MNIFDSKKMAEKIKYERKAKIKLELNKHIKDSTSQRISDIADFNLNGLKDFIKDTNKSINIMGNNTFKNPPKLKSDENIGKNFYGKLNKNNFFKTLLEVRPDYYKKNQTGDELINGIKNIKSFASSPTKNTDSISYKEIKKAGDMLKKIKAEGGYIASFDLETLGGTNSYGHQQLDFITEISATERFYNPKTGKLKDVKSVNSLLGFSEREYKNLTGHLESLKNKPYNQLSNSDQVLISRLSMMSDEGIKITKKGFEVKISDTKEAGNVETTIENALKGLKKYKEIGEYQEEWIKSSKNPNISLEDYRKEYVKKAVDLLSGIEKDENGNIISQHDVLALGQNSRMFDLPAMEHYTGEHIEIPNHLDAYQVTKYTEEYRGQGANIHGLKDITGNYVKTSNKYGTGTQDQIKHMLKKDIEAISEETGEDLTQSHNAHIDETLLAHAVMNTNYYDVITSNIEELNKKVPVLDNATSKDIFFMNKTSKMSYSGHKNALSFNYDPVSKSIKTYDGFRISEDGKIVKEGFNGFGPKEGALYTHEVYKIDLNNENWKSMFDNLGLPGDYNEKFYQEYKDAKSLYLVKSNEVIDKEKIIKKFGKDSVQEHPVTHFRFAKSEDEIATMTGIAVGEIDKNGNPRLIEDRIKNLGLSTTSLDKNGKVVITPLEPEKALDMLLERSTYRTNVDSATRKIRETSYQKFEKIRQYEKLNNLKIADRISESVSHGKTVNMNLQNELLEELGWTDFTTGKQTIVPETIRNAPIIEKQLESTGVILDSIDKEFNKRFQPSFVEATSNSGYKYAKSISGYNMRAENANKDIIFKKVYNDILEELANTPSEAKNSRPVIQTSRELNKIDFKKFDLFPGLEGKSKRANFINSNSEFATIDLERDDSILKLFFNNIYKNNSNANIKGAEGYNSLYEAYNKIANDERFYGVWGNFTRDKFNSYIENGESTSSLNDRMVTHLKKFIKEKRNGDNNSGFGLLFPREMQDPVSPFEVLESYKVNGQYPIEFINKIDKMVQDKMSKIDIKTYSISKSKGDNNKIIDELVNNYFMSFSKEDLMNGAKGYTKEQQNVIKTQYNAALSESRKEAEKLVNAIAQSNSMLSIYGTGENSKLLIKDGEELGELGFHKYVQHDGIIFNKIGEQEYANQLVYDVSNYIKKGRVRPGRNTSNFTVGKDIKIANNVERAYNNESDLYYTVDNALKSGESVVEALSRKINNINGVIRESSPRKETFNFNNGFSRNFDFDINSLVQILPELNDKGYIDNIAKSYNIPPEYIELFKDAIKKMESGEARPEDVASLLSSDKNIFLQMIQVGLPGIINPQLNLDNVGEDSRDVISLLNNAVKNTTLTEGKLSLNPSPYAMGLAGFDKGTRPPQFQAGNNVLIDKEILKKDIEDLKHNEKTKEIAKYLDVTPSTSTKASEKFMFSAGVNQNKTTGLTMQYLQMDSNGIRNALKEDVNNARENKDNRFSQYISKSYPNLNYEQSKKATSYLAERSMNMSTYEQESVMNSRIAYMAFSDTNIQSIDAKKNLLLEHKRNLDVIDSTINPEIKNLYPIIADDGSIRYLTGFEVKQGQVLGLFGENEEAIKSKYDGVFRSRYYRKNGEMATEEELNNFIKNLNENNHENIIEKLSNAYDLRYEVIPKYDTNGKKIFTEASEKSTVTALDVPLGTIDPTLIEDLEKDLKGTGINVESLKDKVLNKKYLEEYLEPNLKDKSLKDRILKERFSLSDTLSTFEPFKGIGVISALDENKHESVSMPLSDILNKIKNSPDKKAYHKAMFKSEGPLMYSKDGSLLTDNIKEIKVSGFTKNDFESENAEELAANLNKLISTPNYVRDKNGNIIGNKGIGHVIQLIDDEGGSYAGNEGYLKSINKNLRKTVNRLETDGNLSLKNRRKLEKKADFYREMLNKSEGYKGVKYTKNMNNILQRDTYNDDTISSIQKAFHEKGLDDEFEKIYGHAVDIKTGKIKKEYKNKPMLGNLTENLRSYLSAGPGEITLAETEKLGGPYANKYKYLLDTFNTDKNSISVNKAINRYSLLQGEIAIDYNKNPTHSRLIELSEKGREADRFKIIDMSKGERLDLDIGGQGDTVVHAGNNPYTQNLILQYGDKANENIAIPRMSEKHYEDKLITKQHIDKLPALQRIMDEINSGNFKGEELKAKIDTRNRIIADIKKAQIKDIRGKNGLWANEIETRLDQSFRGKASGLTINSLGRDLEKITKSDSKKYLSELRKNNGNLLDNVYFEGKSLLEHYSEGKVIDSMFLSRKAFEDMGYFDLPYMKKIFKNMDMPKKEMNQYRKYIDIANKKRLSKNDINSLTKGMEDLLSTHGDMFVSTRYPEIQEGSSKIALGFLGKDLKDNEIRTFGASELAMNADHDGDQISIFRAKTRNNESYLNFITNKKGASSELTEQVQGNEASLVNRSVGVNLYWNEEMQGKLAKEHEVATLKNGSVTNRLSDVAPTKVIDNSLIKDIVPTKNLSHERMAELNNAYKEAISIAKEDGNHKNALKYIKENLKDFNVKDYNEALKQYKVAYGFENEKDALIAKSSNKAIGEINVTNNKVKQVLLQLLDKQNEDYNYNTFLISDVVHKSEEAAISAKSNTKHLEPNRAKIWNELQTNLISGKGDENEIKLKMKDWANNYLKNDIDVAMHYSNSELFRKKVNEKLKSNFTIKEFINFAKDEKNASKISGIKEDLINDYVNLLGGLRHTSRSSELLKQFSLGQSLDGVKNGTEHLIKTGYHSNLETAIEGLEKANLENLNLKFIKSTEKMNKKSFSEKDILEKGLKEALNDNKESISDKALQATGDVLKGIKSSKIAVGALALAAGVMIAGFAGGRPRPAETHAMEEENNNRNENDQTPVLADPGLSYNQATGKNGYVVNINATTSKSRDRIMHSMQQVISDNSSGNININMNYNDNKGNISDKEIEKALANVLS